MSISQTISTLVELQAQLMIMRTQAQELIDSLPEQFFSAKARADGYKVWEFGSSDNRYDVTFDTVMTEIQQTFDELHPDEQEGD